MACSGSASQAFRMLKENPEGEAPALASDGNPSVLPPDRLEYYKNKYSNRWCAFNDPIETVIWDPK